MDAQFPLELVIAVVVIALVVGATMIFVVLGKYWKHQWFHVIGGPVLTGFGVVLIGLTVYGNVKLKAGEFEIDIQRLEAELKESEQEKIRLKTQLASIESGLSGIAQVVNSTSQYVARNQNLSNDRELSAKVMQAQQRVQNLWSGIPGDMEFDTRE